MNAMDTDTENAGTYILPQEVLTLIIQFLPLKDRNTARLVCKQWYDAADTIPVLANEKLVILNVYSTSEISEVLMNCKRRFMNLEFHEIKFDAYSISLWNTCGFKILSVEFFNCQLDIENFEKVIENCENLVHFGWRHCDSLYSKWSLYYDHALERLIRNGIERKGLRSLKIYLPSESISPWISTKSLPLLFSVYTEVRKFEFHSWGIPVNSPQEALQAPADTITSYSILDKLVSSVDVITEVKFALPSQNQRTYRGFTCVTSEPILDFIRSREIPIDDSMIATDWMKSIDFCIRRRNLKKIEFDLNAPDFPANLESFVSRFLLDVLRECPQLRHLCIITHPFFEGMDFTCEIFTSLLTSHLESLEFLCRFKSVHPLIYNRAAAGELPENFTLRDAVFEKHPGQLVPVLRLFKGLRRLYVDGCGHDELQSIWQHQTNLSCLELMNVSPYTASFIGPNTDSEAEDQFVEAGGNLDSLLSCIDRLQNLEYLRITAIEPDWNATDTIFDYFVFPKLRIIRLEILDNFGVNSSMLSMMSRFPLLEVIVLSYYNDVPFESWLDVCNNVKRLRYLLITGCINGTRLAESQYRGLFNACPTLRTIYHSCGEHLDQYVYHVVRKEVVEKTESYIPNVIEMKLEGDVPLTISISFP